MEGNLKDDIVGPAIEKEAGRRAQIFSAPSYTLNGERPKTLTKRA